MNAIILSIGDELILGQTVDTNSGWLSQQLAGVGVPVLAHVTLADDQQGIEESIRGAAGKCDVLLISGGLGPTADDLTRQALAAVMGQPLELNSEWLAALRGFFEKLQRAMPESNTIQAMIPRGARMIFNHAGTAAGIDAELSQAGGRRCRVFVMPGVPKEMKAMFTRDVLPHLQGGGGVILSRTLHTFGLGESTVGDKLGKLMDRTRNPSVGTTVSGGIVSLRINSRFPSRDEAQRQLDATDAACREVLGDLVFGVDGQSLPEVVGGLLTRNSGKALTVTTAESCTGGLVAKMLTDISGSSTYFRQGWVTYSNEAKRDRLGVSENILHSYGAVSEPVVVAMATNARRLARADFALAISGVAGPTGGTPAKPVGMVCIALAFADPATAAAGGGKDARFASSQTLARTFRFTGDREMVRDRSAKMALTLLRYHLLGKPLPF